MARMCASLKDPRDEDPRCPLVPKLTSWVSSARSGPRSAYSRSSRAGSTRISRGAGRPARGEIAIVAGSFVKGSWPPLQDHERVVDGGDRVPLRERLQETRRKAYAAVEPIDAPVRARGHRLHHVPRRGPRPVDEDDGLERAGFDAPREVVRDVGIA